MEKLFELLAAISPLSSGLREYLESIIKRRVVEKKTILLNEGQIAKHIYFVEKGVLRGYHFRNEKEHTSWIMRENEIVISVESFFRQEPSTRILEVLEDSIIHSMTYEQLETAYILFPEYNRHGRLLSHHYYALSEKRHDMREQPALDRIKYLMKYHADLVGRVPDKYLASYLGMSVSTFAAEKRNYARGK